MISKAFIFSHAEVSDDGRYVILTSSEGCDPVNRLYICDLEKIGYNITGKIFECLSLFFVLLYFSPPPPKANESLLI